MTPRQIIEAVRGLIAWDKSLNQRNDSGPHAAYGTVATAYQAGFSAGIHAAFDCMDEELRGAIARGISTTSVLERWTERAARLAGTDKVGA